MKAKLTILIISLSCAISGVSYYYIQKDKHALPPSCVVRYTTEKSDVKINTFIHFTFNDKTNEGTATLDGEVFKQHTPETILHRKMQFVYTSEDNHLYMNAKSATKLNDDNSNESLLFDNLPGFFLRENYSIIYSITRQGRTAYIFSEGALPIFYCSDK
ncbi:hypothetical protein [Citrobacter koseri]|uniref:hypothetical protein n=1 Tax=Citrobacter koseri TaxID=545 RepID=UPI0028BE7061|nr:hypothetical protein [Citrobacter koseri]MDT7487300.1 hypothetical protein [Citrobacter koseri]